MYVGSIIKVNIDRGYAFIRTPSMTVDIFCHVSDFDGGLEFDSTLQERRVQFELASGGPRGPRAIKVKPAE